MEKRVVITGIGAITPVGNHAEDTWKNLVEGKCGIDFIKGYDEYNLPVKVAGQIKDFNQSEYELSHLPNDSVDRRVLLSCRCRIPC